MINVGIKPVFVGGQQQTSGFLYGLRVHETVQGAGVGLRLLQGAEHGAAQVCKRRMPRRLRIRRANPRLPCVPFADPSGYARAEGMHSHAADGE